MGQISMTLKRLISVLLKRKYQNLKTTTIGKDKQKS